MGELRPRAEVIDEPPVKAAAVAHMLGVSVRKVQQMAAAGDLQGAARIGKIWTFDPHLIRAWRARLERQNWRPGEHERLARTKKTAAAEKMMSRTASAGAILEQAMPWPTSGCGIYFLISDGEIKYVGQAISVSARVAQHAATRSFDAWAWVPCRKNHLDALERAYLNKLLPAWNRDVETLRRRNV